MTKPELPPLPDAILAGHARHFADVWAELGPDLPDDYDCHLTCAEADSLCELLRAAGHRAAGDSVLAAHAAHDDEGDGHYIGGIGDVVADSIEQQSAYRNELRHLPGYMNRGDPLA